MTTGERCRCQHGVNMHEWGVGRCRCGCGWFGPVEEYNRRAIEKAERARQAQTRDCMCPAQNPDCQHPTCPRFPQPGHYEAMVVAVRDLAERERRNGGLVDPTDVLRIVDPS